MDIQESFNTTLQKSTLPDAGIDLTEASIDSLLDNDLVKQIPIVKTLLGLMQTGANIRDRLFIKKIVIFLTEIDKIPEMKRQEEIYKIDNSAKYKTKVGEKLLYLLDSCADSESAELLATLFRATLSGHMSYAEFVKAGHIVSRVHVSVISEFIIAPVDPIDLRYNNSEIDISSGLYVIVADETHIEVRDNDDHKVNQRYVAEAQDGGIWAEPSQVGHAIKNALEAVA